MAFMHIGGNIDMGGHEGEKDLCSQAASGI